MSILSAEVRDTTISTGKPNPGNTPGLLPSVKACSNSHREREGLEQYISSIFSAAYGARILEYLPLLFSLESDGVNQAALGLRSAHHGPLFCEQYLDVCAQQHVRELYGREAGRGQIMELGNLVATEPGHSGLLYIIITAAMHEAGIEYLLFAANKRVRNSIARCGFTPREIRAAQQSRLGSQGLAWGRYYEGDPVVMLGDIALTMRQINTQPALQGIVDAYQFAIPALADSIRIHMLSTVE